MTMMTVLVGNDDDVLQLHTFTGPKYVSMDTLFSLVDATLYAHLVDLKDRNPELLPGKVRYVAPHYYLIIQRFDYQDTIFVVLIR